MKKLTSSGAILSAFFASACCILPVVLGSIAGLAGFASFSEKLRPVFLAIAALFLSYGYYVAYFKKQRECESNEPCRTTQGRKKQRVFLVVITVVVIVIATFPYWIMWIF